MSKQKKTPERSPEKAGGEREGERRTDVDPAVLEQHALGNAALMAQLGGEHSEGLEAARDVAFPMVERAVLALEILPPDNARVDRFVDILAASHLPQDRKEVLTERLRTSQTAASGVRDALVARFGEDTEAIRGQVGTALDAVWSALEMGKGAADQEVWRVGSVDVALGAEALTGPVSERAEALVSDLATGLDAAVVDGPSPRNFCRDVLLALAFEEEEDEEEEWALAFGLEEG